MQPVSTTPEVDALIRSNAPVVIGVSGGIDSQGAALAMFAHLDQLDHTGPRKLIHADLGSVEWADSLPVCERLAAHLKTELIVVRRKAGGMMERWESRWASSVRRYIDLETVTLVLPWSTPSMRFCTSELKTHVINAELKRRFKGQTIINVTGVRRDESRARSKQPIADCDATGMLWNLRIIADWSKPQTFDYVTACGLRPHRAYNDFGMSRVSCRFCIMSCRADMAAATRDPAAHDLYRQMVGLEIASTFGFQGSRWLADVAPDLLDDATSGNVVAAKERAALRVEAESRITKGMLYEKGWPTRMLTDDEADILADVRRSVSILLGFNLRHVTRDAIHGRYAELIDENARRKADGHS